MRLIALLTRRIEQRVGELLGINLTDLVALDHLIAQGPKTPSDLASLLEVTTAASTHIVDRLERAGHVSREPDATDRRKVLVVPVAASVDRVRQVVEPVLERLDAIIDGLSEADVAVIERFLGQIIDFYVAELQRPLGTPTPSKPSSNPPRRRGKGPSHG
ncbi:MarR family winged helix-turn-helix transcriptional regulator [Melittangium boletus]|uniref:MarR family winged helix-turn-helix transcriptional regulator n=1 Tax=Melittangium boletus TaxID=83453 RepID=UPI001FE2FF26|nr:MarR family transcriptional regulator [Melittangium boletus]